MSSMEKQAEFGDNPMDWYALRVDPRRPSVGDCPVRRIDHPEKRQRVGSVGALAVPEVARMPLRAEFVVQGVMRRRGIEARVPVETHYIRHNRYRRTAKALVYQPIVPGWVFVRLPALRFNWSALLDCPMVRGVMGFGGAPVPLGDGCMDRLEEIEDKTRARAHHRFMPTGRVYEVGQVVEVIEGALEAQAVTVVEISGATARVFCRLFGGDYEATIGLEKLAAVV